MFYFILFFRLKLDQSSRRESIAYPSWKPLFLGWDTSSCGFSRLLLVQMPPGLPDAVSPFPREVLALSVRLSVRQLCSLTCPEPPELHEPQGYLSRELSLPQALPCQGTLQGGYRGV